MIASVDDETRGESIRYDAVSPSEEESKKLRKPAGRCSTPCILISSIILLILIFIGVCVYFALDFNACTLLHPLTIATTLPDPTNLGPLSTAEKNAKHFLVQLHGDSELMYPYQRYHLHERIMAHLNGYNFTLQNWAGAAKNLSITKYEIGLQTKRWNPDCIIVCTGTDVTNQEFSTLSADTIHSYLHYYARDARAIVTTAQQEGRHILLTSPGSFLLEGHWLFYPYWSMRFANEKVLHYIIQFRAILQSVAQQTNVPFVDLREPFYAQVFWWRWSYKGCVLYDGEHANAHGVEIMATLYAQVLQRWFYEDLHAIRKKKAGTTSTVVKAAAAAAATTAVAPTAVR